MSPSLREGIRQNASFRRIWMFRSLRAVPVTAPKFELLNTLDGVPNVGVLNALNSSRRNSTYVVSENRNYLNRDRSKFETPSVRTLCRPEFPNCRMLVPGTKSGQSSAPVLIQRAVVWFES